MEVIRTSYMHRYPLKKSVNGVHLSLLGNIFFKLIVNGGEDTVTNDLYFELGSDRSSVTKVWKEKYDPIGEGRPTRKTALVRGWDDSNDLMLATITQRGISYASILSRTINH